MRTTTILAVVAVLAVGVGWTQMAFCAETIITVGGSVLAGTIESGLPANVSVTSETGDVFAVQRANMKHIRFGEGRAVTVETFDGNIIVGTLAGISDVFGLRTPGGDVQSINVDSIVEIRFEGATPSAGPTVTLPTPRPTQVASVDAVVEQYESRSGSVTLGLDLGLQLGYSVLNGFELPRFTIGVNAILLGVVGRLYFPPSVEQVERIAKRVQSGGTSGLDALIEETREEATPVVMPYAQLGTDALIIPHIGGGLIFRLGRAFYVDLGGTIDMIGVPWLSFGVLIFL